MQTVGRILNENPRLKTQMSSFSVNSLHENPEIRKTNLGFSRKFLHENLRFEEQISGKTNLGFSRKCLGENSGDY